MYSYPIKLYNPVAAHLSVTDTLDGVRKACYPLTPLTTLIVAKSRTFPPQNRARLVLMN